MTRVFLTTGLCAALTGLVWGSDLLPATAKPLSEILQILEANGIAQVKEAEFDDGLWEIEGVRDQKGVELRVNPATGAILTEEADQHSHLPPATAKSALQIAQQLEGAGFKPVYEIEWKGKYWKAEAIHQNVRRDLHLSPETGEILSNELDD